MQPIVYMKEQQEIKLKKSLMDFVNKEVVIALATGMTPEAGQLAVSDRKYQLVDLLYGLFEEFYKYTNPPKIYKYEKL